MTILNFYSAYDDYSKLFFYSAYDSILNFYSAYDDILF